MKFSHLIITFAAISISGCTVDSTQEKATSDGPLDLYGSEHEITLHSETKPQGKAAGAFQRFKKGGKEGKGYYGAFAYSLGGGAYGGYTGYNSLKTARESALAGCSIYRKKGESACKIIAVLVPKGYVNKQGMTLSKNATKALRDLKNNDKYRAIATNDAGYFDHGWKYETQELANRNILEGCNLHAKVTTPRHEKLYPCYLISEEQ
jgi:hypothetical protein